jgi:hypothetical protein
VPNGIEPHPFLVLGQVVEQQVFPHPREQRRVAVQGGDQFAVFGLALPLQERKKTVFGLVKVHIGNPTANRVSPFALQYSHRWLFQR